MTNTKCPYLHTMFAMCMTFMTLYTLCVVGWIFFPDLAGHEVLTVLIPKFQFLDIVNFMYGFIMTGIYGAVIGGIYVFFSELACKIFQPSSSSSSCCK
ncbi:MAG: hypothetical protein EYC62_06525 [Alphaproteobacteria bacterium]|nr:MAG: hypothetical protein EYC62_06525 [Alphaproteobacteria bacterium]